MTCARTIALALTVSVAAVASYAQQVTSPPAIDRPPLIAVQAAPSLDESASLAAARSALSIAPDALPDAPAPPMVRPGFQPQIVSEHKFWDHQQELALAVHSAVRVADTIKTCRELRDGGVEDWIPTQSCAGVAVWNAASVGAALGVGWLFHKYGLHRLERLTPWVATGASAAGLTKSVFNIH
jgi:hypothetical protein